MWWKQAIHPVCISTCMHMCKYTKVAALGRCSWVLPSSALHTSAICRKTADSAKSLSHEFSSSLTLCNEEHGIRTITLNNPKKRNALSLAMLESLCTDLTRDIDDTSLRVIIIRASGPVFSAGHDLKELTSDTGIARHTQLFDVGAKLMNLIQDIPVPVLAQVHGLATAAGCQLVATCDIAVASNKATFATPGVSVGLFCSTPGVAVARSIPKKVALDMLFTGQPITAQEALMHGLVSRVVPEEVLHNEVMKIALRICETSRPVVALGKRMFYKQIAMSRDGAYSEASKAMVDNLRLRDAQEGIRAFVEKRHPTWTHTQDTQH